MELCVRLRRRRGKAIVMFYSKNPFSRTNLAVNQAPHATPKNKGRLVK